VKLRTLNSVCVFTGSIGLLVQKSIKNVGKSSRGHSQGLLKIFRAVIYRAQSAHRAVVFAIAQLSCVLVVVCSLNRFNKLVHSCAVVGR